MTREFDALVNGAVSARNAIDAVEVVRTGNWLNYQEEDGTQHGNIVWLFPRQRRTKVTERIIIGWPIPLLVTEGERYHHYTVRKYGVGVILRGEADSETDAANYLQNRSWLIPGRGIEITAASAPAPRGGFDGLIEKGLAELERVF